MALLALLALLDFGCAANPPNPVRVSKVDFLGPQRAQRPDGSFPENMFRDGGSQGILNGQYFQVYKDVCTPDYNNPVTNCDKLFRPNMIALQTYDPTISQNFNDPPLAFCAPEDRIHMADMVPIDQTRGALWYVKLRPCKSDELLQINGCADSVGVAIAAASSSGQPSCSLSKPGTWWDTTAEPQWGATAAVASPKDGKIYLFGTLDLNAPGGNASDVYVARVSPSQVENIASYEYWNGEKYTTERLKYPNFNGFAPASILQNTAVGSVFYSPYYQQWVALSSPNHNDVVAHTASEPQGPWSNPVTLWSNTTTGGLYLPTAITSFDLSGRSLIVDISQWGKMDVQVVLRLTFG